MRLLFQLSSELGSADSVGYVDGLVVGGDGEPGVGVGAEAGLVIFRAGGSGGPLHGGAFAVAAFFFGPAGDADGVFYVLDAGGSVGGHAELFAVVHEGGGAGGEEHGGDELGDLLGLVDAVAEAVPGADVVVVVEDEEGWLRAVDLGLDLGEELAEVRRR